MRFSASLKGANLRGSMQGLAGLERVVNGWRGLVPVLTAVLVFLLSAADVACTPWRGMEGMTHRRWGIEDGLPDQTVLAVAQSSDGYLWLGTPHGLFRFDGFKFVNAAANVAPTLEEFGVYCILAARDGSLWTGSAGGGVTHLRSGAAEHFGAEHGLRSLSVRTLYQTPDGVVWAGTDRGLYRFERDHFEFVAQVGEQWITTISSDGGAGFWVAGTHLLHCTQGRFESIPLPPLKLPIRALAQAPDGTLWIGAFGSLLKRSADGVLQPVAEVHADVRTLQINPSGGVWIGTIGSGMLLCQPDGRMVQVLSASEPGSRAVRAMVLSHSGELWVGTQEGLIRFSRTGIDFASVPHASGADYSSVLVDRDGAVWLSAGSLTRWMNHEVHSVPVPQLAKTSIRCIFRERDGALWVGTISDGAFRILHGVVDAHFESTLGSNAVTGFAEAPDGTLWIGTDTGLVHWANHKLTAYNGGPQYPLGVGTVRSIAFAPDGAIWLATPAGLMQFRDGLFTRPEMIHQLSRYRIWSLYADHDGSLWIGTGTGLYLWRGGSLRHIVLPRITNQTQAVISILKDTQKRFLIALPNTVFRIASEDVERSLRNPVAGGNGVPEILLSSKPEIFAVAGETGSEIYSDLLQLAATDRQGGAWYACTRGLLHITPHSITRQEPAPPVVIERIVVDGVPVANNGPILLPPSAHNIEIGATPILLSSRSGLELRRRLVGLEDKWTAIMPGASSSYAKLPPGKYTFRVEASWGGGAAASAAEVVIIQQISIFRTKWFLAGCLVAFALLIWLFLRMRLHQMRLRFQAVAAERTRMAREIHDTLLQGCIGAVSLLEAIEISHDQVCGDLPAGQRQRWRSTLAYVREQMTESIKEAREAIWNLRSSDVLKPLDEALRDLLDRLTSRAQVHAAFEVEGEVPRLVARAQHELVMATREAILNALAHARPQNIRLNLHAGEGKLTIRVADDGAGFDADAPESASGEHFGLAGMRDRMRKFGGTMTIESRTGEGTSVLLLLPLGAEVIRSRRFLG